MQVVGYNDMDEMLHALAQGLSHRCPAARFAFDLRGTRTAPPALIDGTSKFAPMGADMEDAQLARYRATRGHEPARFAIAHASLSPAALSSPTGILVHKDNPLRAISMAQLRSAFAKLPPGQRITRWGQLGLGGAWRDRPIHIVGLDAQTAIGALTLRRLGTQEYADGFSGKAQSRDVAEVVARDPLALAIANLNHAGPRAPALGLLRPDGKLVVGDHAGIRSGRYPFDRHLLIYARRTPAGTIEPEAAAFLAFALSNEGQRIIGAGSRGYIPLNETERLAQRELLLQIYDIKQ